MLLFSRRAALREHLHFSQYDHYACVMKENASLFDNNQKFCEYNASIVDEDFGDMLDEIDKDDTDAAFSKAKDFLLEILKISSEHPEKLKQVDVSESELRTAITAFDVSEETAGDDQMDAYNKMKEIVDSSTPGFIYGMSFNSSYNTVMDKIRASISRKNKNDSGKKHSLHYVVFSKWCRRCHVPS